LEAIYVGAADIARGKVRSLRNPEYRKKYEDAYRLDLKRYGVELTLEEANKKLLARGRGIRELPKIRKMHGICKPLSKEDILVLNRMLLYPEDVERDLTIDNPIELGQIAEILYAERLPTIRLWVHWKDYVMGVVPDGIADSYTYEFKATTQSGRDAEDVKAQAVRQVQLYAYAFKRPNIKAQIAQFQLSKDAFPVKVKDLAKPDIATITRPGSEDEALTILEHFDRIFRQPHEER